MFIHLNKMLIVYCVYFYMQSSCLVFAGLADSLISVFPVSNGIPSADCSYICSRTANRSIFKIGDEDSRQNPYPVLAMEIANGGSEVWYSNGPGLLIVDCTSLKVTKRLEPYNAPSFLISMATSADCNGEDTVWCLDDKTNTLVMYHAVSYQLCARYFCGDCSPLRDMFAVKTTAELAPITLPHTNCDRQCQPEVSITYSQDRGVQLLSHQDSLTDYCSLSSSSSVPQGAAKSSSSLPSTPVSYNSTLFSTDSEGPELSREQRPRIPSESWGTKAPPTDEEKIRMQAVRVLAVKDLLWIPR